MSVKPLSSEVQNSSISNPQTYSNTHHFPKSHLANTVYSFGLGLSVIGAKTLMNRAFPLGPNVSRLSISNLVRRYFTVTFPENAILASSFWLEQSNKSYSPLVDTSSLWMIPIFLGTTQIFECARYIIAYALNLVPFPITKEIANALAPRDCEFK